MELHEVLAVQVLVKQAKRPFARSVHMVRNKLCWDANNAVGFSDLAEVRVLEVPLPYLRPSIIYSVPRDRIVQRAY